MGVWALEVEVMGWVVGVVVAVGVGVGQVLPPSGTSTRSGTRAARTNECLAHKCPNKLRSLHSFQSKCETDCSKLDFACN